MFKAVLAIPVLMALVTWLVRSACLADEAPIETGRKLVEINCTRCHAIGRTGESPFPPAPPFRNVAPNYTFEELTDGFMEGLAVRHPAMPDWKMTLDQAEAISSYIMSLKRNTEKSDASPIGQGFQLLRKNCARCHAIGPEGESPLAKAPPFRDVAMRYQPSRLEEALAEGIVTGHNEMPQFEFTPEEIGAIEAYLESLRSK